AVVVGRKAFGGPDVTGRRARPARGHVLGDLVDLHARAAVGVVARDDSPHLKCHVSPPGVDWRAPGAPVRAAHDSAPSARVESSRYASRAAMGVSRVPG